MDAEFTAPSNERNDIMAKMKVFAGCDMNTKTGTQCNMMVAATSRQKAVEAIQAKGVLMTVGHMANYWAETSNAKQLEVALNRPGVLFQSSNLATDDYTEA